METDAKHLKIELSLIHHAYSQITTGIISSLFCACIVFIGIYDSKLNNHTLFHWVEFFLIVTLSRLILYVAYKKKENNIINAQLWKDLYTIGCFLGGVSWGLAGFMLFPYANHLQQTLIVLMLAGVSAGSVPMSAAIPKAGITFLAVSILSLITSIVLFKNHTYYLFNAALTLYLAYTVTLTFKTYKLIKNSIILKYENDLLLNNLRISNKLLEVASTHDPLTNVANRRLFQINFDHAIFRAQKQNSKFSLFYIDLDHFKLANDTYGHEAGDFILTNVIHRLSVFFRKDDLLSRLGGDEFAIIIENVKSKNELKVIAEKICQLVAIPIKMKGLTLNVTASIGISIYPEDGKTQEELVTYADKNMFYSKKRGGNRFSFHGQSVEVEETAL